MIIQIKIFDLPGHELRKFENYIINDLDVSFLKSGVYFISFKTKTSLVMKKFIKL